MAAAILDAARVRSVLHYDPETGVFIRKERTAQCHRVGDRADLPGHGNLSAYRIVTLGGKKYLAHRLAWMYVHGAMPSAEIDHINGTKDDNRISNLRNASRQLNAENHRLPTKRNKSGFLGVHWNKQTESWRVRLTVARKSIHIGLYATPDDAYAAYLAAKRKYHEGCTI